MHSAPIPLAPHHKLSSASLGLFELQRSSTSPSPQGSIMPLEPPENLPIEGFETLEALTGPS
ncbi:hypothetical protein IMZ48_04800 [Candidatus Bathyarchaeota archaeon]|nr:hypothetical protein [Candidatus Bathyarchaeota archaeon]